MAIEPRMWRELGLSDGEYERVLSQLGREPSATELAMFSVEWSEHCGYPAGAAELFPKEASTPAGRRRRRGRIDVAA
jgi:phosphoribosylformylglycinamidine synthase